MAGGRVAQLGGKGWVIGGGVGCEARRYQVDRKIVRRTARGSGVTGGCTAWMKVPGGGCASKLQRVT